MIFSMTILSRFGTGHQLCLEIDRDLLAAALVHCEVPHLMFLPVDYECISSLVTYDYLINLCENKIAFVFSEADDLERTGTSSSHGNSLIVPAVRRTHSFIPEARKDEPAGPQCIPFPFDLLSLLPFSQQAELLFSSFIMESNSKIKNASLPRAANNVLFSYLLDDMADEHDRHVPLTVEDCSRFLELLKKRERDLTLHPLPFKYGVYSQGQEDDDIDIIQEPEGLESLTDKLAEKDSRFERLSSEYDKVFEPTLPVPRWKCFAKASKQGILSLTFCPASFDDLLFLNNINIPSTPSPVPEHPPVIPVVVEEQDPQDNPEDDISLIDSHSKDSSSLLEPTEENHNRLRKIPELQRLDSEEPSSVSSSKEEDIAEWINTNTLQCRDGPLMVPVYVYSCSHYYIAHSLIHKMDFLLPDDEYEDMTFDISDSSDKFISPRNRLTSLMESEDGLKDEKDESNYIKWGWSSLETKHKENFHEASNEFRILRRNISKSFFSCFVKGVSKSLQQNLSIHQFDLDAAINNICEESLPVESDISSFLHSTCGHLQHLVNRARKAEACGKDVPRRPSVRFTGLIDDDESVSDTVDRIPVILQFPKSTINLSNMVAQREPCEKTPGLCAIICDKFNEITKKWFRPVPSNPDYFYYCPEDTNQVLVEEEENELDDDISSGESIEELEQGDKEELLFDFVDMQVKEIDADGCSISIASSFDGFGSEEEELDRTSDASLYDDSPLFIHFTCTLKNRLDHFHVSARSLPLCIGEILQLLHEDIKEFDLSNLKFTFDINCLTLPGEAEAHRKPSFLRMLSNNSALDSAKATDHPEDEVGDISMVSSDHGIKECLSDPIGHLHKKQYKSMMMFKEEIEWLINDEMVSSLRHLYPIQSDALQFVTEHIKKYKKENKLGCNHYIIPLSFVFGSNQSINRFTEEFERLSVPKSNYSLTKEGDYYFVILNRSHSINILQAEEIAHALVNLSRKDSDQEQKDSPKDLPKGFTKLEERSNSLPSLLLSNENTELPPLNVSALVKKEDSDSYDDDTDDNGLRPRSRSDAKYLRRSASGIDQEVTTAVQVITEIQQALPLFAQEHEPMTPHGILKKSSSFASFDTTATTTCPLLPVNQLSPLKPGGTVERVRNRHFSAPSGPGSGTPQSRCSTLPQTPSWISSRGSCNEDGYEGDSSDEELDDTNSVSDGGQTHVQLPSFWLILQIHPEKAEIFFHTRDSNSSEGNEEEIRERGDRRTLLFHVKQNIQNICKKVNQHLLLKELNDTRMCNSLLVDVAEEDHLWGDKRTSSRSMVESTASEGDDDDSEDGRGRRYLAAKLEFMPGHFSCECMWRTMFVLHSRLKEGTKRGGGVSRGFLALKSVLSKLSVNNRKNMFVIKETQTDNVYYLRMRELKNVPLMDVPSSDMLEDENRQDTCLPIDVNAVASKLEESTSSYNKVEYDSISTHSGLSRVSSRIESVVELLVYGIEEVGNEIQCDLVKALRCKLDEAVLDALSLMLNRNPKCKLKTEDVHFIQDTEVTKVIQLTIPPHAMMYLFALLYYLRQNLLQFLHTPNYDSNFPCDHFQDKDNTESEAVSSENAFLYIRAPAIGKGIAFISLSLVDSTGSPVKLLNCPYPTRMSTCSIQSEEEFEHLVHTVRHDPSSDSSRPGPTALIQFKIWDRFNTKSEMKQLADKLTSAVTQALCDVIIEYNLLTAPICHIPRQHDDDSELHHSSVPSSPVSPKGNNKDRRHSVIGKRFSDSLSLKPVIQSASPLQSLKSLYPSKSRFSTPPPQSSPMFEFPESSPGTSDFTSLSSREVSPTSSGMKEVRMKYESGERGNLHTVYPSVIKPWIKFCSKLGVPSISKFELHLLSKFSVDYTLKEMVAMLPTVCSNHTYRLFKLVNRADSLLTGVPYFPCRSPVQPAEDNMETSLDAARHKPSIERSSPGYCVIGRDVEQWRSVVIHDSLFTESLPALSTKNKSNQKFRPYVLMDQGSSDGLAQFRGEQDFIPRQKLLTIYVQDRQIMVATYNWATDLFSSLEKNVTRLVHWHNARIHLLESIHNQKMGLFHHNMTFRDLPYTMDQNPYTQPTYEKEVLIRNLAPPRDPQRRHGPTKYNTDLIPQFDEIYKEEPPHIPLHKNTKISTTKDSVYVQGVQALEIRSRCLKEAERFNILSTLYNTWLGKAPGNSSVNEDHLKLLKQSSRLFHYCTTPILFSAKWRHRVVERNNVHFKQETVVESTPPASDLPKSRSRHSSGASITSLKNKRSESQDGRRRPTTPQDSPEVRHVPQEEMWHIELRASFLNEYMSYLHNLGFKTINVQISARKRLTKTKSGDNQNVWSGETESTTTMPSSLQKTLTGGIILMDIGYRDGYFCVKLYVFDYSQITNINQQMKILFVDECQRYKDLIHVHSFAHDFHLRCVQRYISGDDCVFNQGFHLANFLTDFSHIYSYAPSFSRNCLQYETVPLSDSHGTNDQVFEYMIKQMKNYEMRVVKMKNCVDYDVEPDYCFVKNDEFALVRHRKLIDSSNFSKIKDADDYDVGLIITQESVQYLKPAAQEADKQSLRLKYFVLLTRRRDCFPMKNLEKGIGGIRAKVPHLLPADLSTGTADIIYEPIIESETFRTVPVKQHIGVRQEIVDYLGYSNKHQASIFELLSKEMKSSWNEIKEMVDTSKRKCRRDLLWKRMLLVQVEDDTKKRKKTDLDERDTTNMTRLSFEEFQELLLMVIRTPISNEDAQLIPLATMPIQWYRSLVPILITKYSTQHRSFTSTDGQNQCILILNANYLSMFIMLEITPSKADISVIIQDPIT